MMLNFSVVWFQNSYTQSNQDKCHLIVCGNYEQTWVKIGDPIVLEIKSQ